MNNVPKYSSLVTASRIESAQDLRRQRLQPARLFIGLLTLMYALLSISFGLRADEYWWIDHTEAQVNVGAYLAGEHLAWLAPSERRTLRVCPTLRTWGVYTLFGGSAAPGISNDVTNPIVTGTVTFTLESGEATFDSATATINQDGQATLTTGLVWTPNGYEAVLPFVVGASGSSGLTIRVDVATTYYDLDNDGNYVEPSLPVQASQWMTFDVVDETWHFDHQESSLMVSLPNASFQPLPFGETRTIEIHGDLKTWDIYVSDSTGHTDIRNLQISPASGATVDWSVTRGGGTIDADASGGLQSQLDGQGNSSAVFTMTGTNWDYRNVTATLSYGNSTQSASGIYFLWPTYATGTPEVFTFDHNEGYISATMAPAGSSEGVTVGTQVPVITTVTHTTWEVWRGDQGHTQYHARTTAPATGAVVLYTTIQDGASIEAGSSTTDANGESAYTFTMGGADAILRADVSFAGASSIYTTLNVTGPSANDWVFDHWEESLNLSLNSATNQSVANVATGVSYTSREIWRSDSTGGTQVRNPSTVPATGAILTWSVVSGDACVVSGDSNTDGNGGGYASINLGSMASRLHVTASYPSGVSGYAELDLNAVSDGTTSTDNWVFDHLEGSIAVSLTDEENTGNNVDTLHAVATATTWEVWRNTADDSSQYRNPGTFPASNADITWVGSNTFQNNADELGRAQMDVSRGSETNTFSVTASIIAWNRVPESGAQLYPPIITGSGSIIVGPASSTGGGDSGQWTVDHTDFSNVIVSATVQLSAERQTATILASGTVDWVEVLVNSQTNATKNGASGRAAVTSGFTGDGPVLLADAPSVARVTATAGDVSGSTDVALPARAYWVFDHTNYGDLVVTASFTVNEGGQSATISASATVQQVDVWVDTNNPGVTKEIPQTGVSVPVSGDGEVALEDQPKTVTVTAGQGDVTGAADVNLPAKAPNDPPPPPPPPPPADGGDEDEDGWSTKSKTFSSRNGGFKHEVSWEEYLETPQGGGARRITKVRGLHWKLIKISSGIDINNGIGSMSCAGVTLTEQSWFGSPRVPVPAGITTVPPGGNTVEPQEIVWDPAVEGPNISLNYQEFATLRPSNAGDSISVNFTVSAGSPPTPQK